MDFMVIIMNFKPASQRNHHYYNHRHYYHRSHLSHHKYNHNNFPRKETYHELNYEDLEKKRK
uniref:Uncharacterized protein n=1 Tax=Glossina palpalis gambiensis TaxID=67801 RepID=A0A1B0ASH6_9MUSC